VPRRQCRLDRCRPKGATIAFRNGVFPNPGRLVEWITGQGTLAKLRPADMKLVIKRNWDTAEERLKGTRLLMQNLVKLAA
jgi:transcription-repair coupling factor (superfamily II helicase)